MCVVVANPAVIFQFSSKVLTGSRCSLNKTNVLNENDVVKKPTVYLYRFFDLLVDVVRLDHERRIGQICAPCPPQK